MFDEASLNSLDFETLMDALPPGLDLILVALPQMPGQRSSGVLPQLWKGDIYISNDDRMGWIKLPPLRQKGKIALRESRLDLIADSKQSLNRHGDLKERTGPWVAAVPISPDNRWVVTGSGDNTARLWDLSAKDPAANPVVLRGHEYWVAAVAISRDNSWLVTGSGDNTARLWDLSAKNPAANPVVLRCHESAVEAMTPMDLPLFELGTSIERSSHKSTASTASALQGWN